MSAMARKRRRMRRSAAALLRAFISRRGDGATPARPCHWIHGANEIAGIGCTEGDDFCEACADQKVAEIFRTHPDEAERWGISVDGGWSTDHDSPPFCTSCDTKLDGSLTDHGSEEELDALTTYAAPRDADGWDALLRALENVDQCWDDRSVIGPAVPPEDPRSAELFQRWLTTWRRVLPVVRASQRSAEVRR